MRLQRRPAGASPRPRPRAKVPPISFARSRCVAAPAAARPGRGSVPVSGPSSPPGRVRPERSEGATLGSGFSAILVGVTEQAATQLQLGGDQPAERSLGSAGVTRVAVAPQLLEWARARSGIDEPNWTKWFPRYDEWLTGERAPTFRQLDEFARRTLTPIGYFFLDEPPNLTVPINDFRTIGDRSVSQAASASLLYTLYRCQARQEWYREHQLLNAESPMAFIGTATTETSPKQVADEMRKRLNWGSESRKGSSDGSTALASLRESAEAIGVLVMISAIVGSNNRRKLDPEEFRGFALSDPYAPLVFVNGADSKYAQIFTLAHELAHLWLGSSALSDHNPVSTYNFSVERWCNQVAAELLVPEFEFAAAYNKSVGVRAQLRPLARQFRVSTQVILVRAREIGVLKWDEYLAEFEQERQLVRQRIEGDQPVTDSGLGGDYYNTKPVQVSKRFARELIASTLEGRTLYTEAFYLLDVKKTATFMRLGEKLGVI